MLLDGHLNLQSLGQVSPKGHIMLLKTFKSVSNFCCFQDQFEFLFSTCSISFSISICLFLILLRRSQASSIKGSSLASLKFSAFKFDFSSGSSMFRTVLCFFTDFDFSGLFEFSFLSAILLKVVAPNPTLAKSAPVAFAFSFLISSGDFPQALLSFHSFSIH